VRPRPTSVLEKVCPLAKQEDMVVAASQISVAVLLICSLSETFRELEGGKEMETLSISILTCAGDTGVNGGD
jgi:hypothetical protein